MGWLELVENPQPITAVFGQIDPVLMGVQMHEILLHHDGPRLMLRFDLGEYPANPPSKWSEAQYNKVQVRLMLIAIYHVHLDGWSTNNMGDMLIDRAEDGNIILQMSSQNCALNVVCGYVRVDGISAYRDQN